MTVTALFCLFPLVKENDTVLEFNKTQLSFSSESGNFVTAELVHEKARPLRILLTSSP